MDLCQNVTGFCDDEDDGFAEESASDEFSSIDLAKGVPCIIKRTFRF